MPPSSLTDWITAITAVVAVLVAVIGLLFAGSQLMGLRDSLRMGSLMAVLAIEKEMADRKERCDDLVARIHELTESGPGHAAKIKIVEDQLNGTIENWLNALERLCFCIEKKYVPEKDWKTEYHEYVAMMIRSHETYFRAGSPYVHILDVHNRWQRGQT